MTTSTGLELDAQSCVTLGKLPNLSLLPLHYLCNEDNNSIYFIELCGLSELINVKDLERYLAHSKYFMNIRYSYSSPIPTLPVLVNSTIVQVKILIVTHNSSLLLPLHF